MKRVLPVLGAFIALLAGTTQVQSSETVLRVETFNVGLAHGFVDHAEDRAPQIWEHVAQSDADVICLQEVWTDDDRADALEATADSHPHAFLTDTEQVYVSVASFSRRFTVLAPYSNDLEALRAAIEAATGDV